jgi:NADPH:quinone reductase-like Zn-dependent oxidoreductase
MDKNSILVKVHAAALNPADYKIPELPAFLSRRMQPVPAIPGLDFSGTVTAVGSDVGDTYQVGQRVFGRKRESPASVASWGTLCEYVATTSDSLVPFAKLGSKLTLEQAAGLSTAAQAAYQSIAPNVVAGDRVFINGGSGGTGSFAIQIAKALGCHVTASCSERNAELCKSLGADETIVYNKEDVCAVLREKGQIFKLVFDTVGSAPADLYKAADAYLLPEGKYVQIGGDFDLASLGSMLKRTMLPSLFGGGKRKIEMAMLKNNGEDLLEVARLVADGKIKVVAKDVFSFDEAPEAMSMLRTRHARGKIIVRVEDN